MTSSMAKINMTQLGRCLKEDWSKEHPMDKVNEYIDNLRRAFDKDKLQEEVKLINSVVTAGEFWHYFKTNTESTKSSPSGRHMDTTRPY